MRSAWAPYREIGLVMGRNFASERVWWPYFALACCAAIVIFGGGVALEASVQSMLKVGSALLGLSLQIAWIFIASGLMALNHPNVARTVPGYVGRLRWMLLLTWLIVCALTGALSAGSWGDWLPGACSAGALMLLFLTPFRWPLRWILFVIVLATLLRTYPLLGEWVFMRLVSDSPDFQWTLVLALFVGMGWLVTRLIPTGGSSYARVFSRYTGMSASDFRMERREQQLVPAAFSVLEARTAQWAHYLDLPLRWYAGRLLRSPRKEHGHVLVRAELLLGSIHWVTQVGVALVMLGVASMALLIGSWLSGTSARQLLMEHAGLLAGLSLGIAVLPVLALRLFMLSSVVEQGLLLLVPGMPRGARLNRLLAVRQLRQGLLGWLLAALVAVNLPFRSFDSAFFGSLYMIGLLLVPLAIEDWARIRPPTGQQFLAVLLVVFVVQWAGFHAMYRLHLPGLAVGLITLAIWSTLMTYRWRRMAHFPQALPAGRLASSRP